VPDRPWSPTAEGIALAVRVTPRGGRDAIDGIESRADGNSVLRLRVRAAAQDGEANAAVVQLLSRALHVAARDISLVAGATARIKRFRIAGPSADLVAALETIAPADA
jgi:uncharacterized protein (TIGR00251 family)